MADLISEILDVLGEDVPPELGPSQALSLVQSTSADGDKKSGSKKTIDRLQKMLRQAKWAERRWRKRADESWEFYDGVQWTSEDKLTLQDRKQAPVTINRVAPTIDLVLGLQVTQPMDWIAKPVGLQDDGVADAASAALKYVASQNNAFDTLMEAYKDSLVYCVGWVDVRAFARDADPLADTVQIARRDPREIRLDPQSKLKDISDARYVIWTRRVEYKDAIRKYPKLKDKLNNTDMLDSNDEPNVTTYDGIVNVVPPPSTWEDLDWNDYDKEDVDPDNQVVYLHELWERVTRTAYVINHKNGWKHKVFAEDLTPDILEMALSDDVKSVVKTQVKHCRYYVFSGTVLLEEADSPFEHGRFPFVPIWHKRDRNGDPVSMVEQLKDPQREINFRRSRLLWDLLAFPVRVSKRVFAASQMPLEEFENKVQRPDALFIGEQGDVEAIVKPSTANAQFQLMQDAKAEIQSVSGINDDLMGMESSSRSGKAKQITMIQGATIQRPKEANLHLAHKLVGEMVLALIQQFYSEEWVARVTDDAGADTLIPLNQPQFDPMTGQFRVLNNIVQARFDIAVEEAPWSPTQRDRAAEILSGLLEREQDPLMRQALQQAIVIVGEIPHKAKVLGILNRAQAQQAAMMAAATSGQTPQPPGPPGPEGGMPIPVTPTTNIAPLLDPAQVLLGQPMGGPIG